MASPRTSQILFSGTNAAANRFLLDRPRWPPASTGIFLAPSERGTQILLSCKGHGLLHPKELGHMWAFPCGRIAWHGILFYFCLQGHGILFYFCLQGHCPEGFSALMWHFSILIQYSLLHAVDKYPAWPIYTNWAPVSSRRDALGTKWTREKQYIVHCFSHTVLLCKV